MVLDYEPLPPVVGVEAATSDHVLLFPDAGTNRVWDRRGGTDDADVDAALAACEVVVRATFVNQRVAPCPLEPRAGAARWGDDGRLTHWSSCQGAHPVRATLAALYGVDAADVRVVVPDVGGSFGAKARPSPEELLLAAARPPRRAARCAGCPPATTTWSASATRGPSSSTSRSAATATAPSGRCARTSSPTSARTR